MTRTQQLKEASQTRATGERQRAQSRQVAHAQKVEAQVIAYLAAHGWQQEHTPGGWVMTPGATTR